ncbi:MAG TPA: hypothetical protein VFS19_02810 [Planctomycetota bacterium]|nr:hypothetical protein [Planctomycetota bacterium]
MSELNARLEGFAREQLTQGKGTMSIVHELVRIGHIGIEDARAIVEQVRPSVMREAPRRGRSALLFGVLILMIPLSIVGTVLFSDFANSGFISQKLWIEGLWMLLFPPMLFFEGVGLVLIARGLSAMRRSKNTFTPDAPGGPVGTGLWWRADPFQWK